MLIFTVCHINQIFNALVLGDSLKAINSDAQFIIGLIDNKTNIPAEINSPYKIIDFSEIGIENFDEMAMKYTHSELSANCKPFFAKYFIQNFKKVIYFDCTSFIYNSIDFLSKTLDTQDIILVPQLLNAGIHHDEKLILNSGIYHSGVFAIKQSTETDKFLHWWSNNTQNKGFRDLCKGLNTDQLWLEHVPALFQNVYIEKHEGLNIGTWNLPERKIKTIDGQAFVNNSPLISVNFNGMKYWADYERSIKKYPYKNIYKIKPNFGLPDQIDKPFQKYVAKKIRQFNSIFDWIIDKIPVS